MLHLYGTVAQLILKYVRYTSYYIRTVVRNQTQQDVLQQNDTST